MLCMIRFELKKMYSNSVVIGSLAVLLLVCFLILQRSDYVQSEYCGEIYRGFYR